MGDFYHTHSKDSIAQGPMESRKFFSDLPINNPYKKFPKHVTISRPCVPKIPGKIDVQDCSREILYGENEQKFCG